MIAPDTTGSPAVNDCLVQTELVDVKESPARTLRYGGTIAWRDSTGTTRFVVYNTVDSWYEITIPDFESETGFGERGPPGTWLVRDSVRIWRTGPPDRTICERAADDGPKEEQ